MIPSRAPARRRVTAMLVVVLAALPLSMRGAVDWLIAAATDAELEPLLARMTAPAQETVAAWTFWSGQLGGRAVVLTRTEGDPLNAVAAVTLGVRKFQPARVLSFGIARPHDPTLRPFDVILAERFAAFDGFISEHRLLDAGSDSAAWSKLAHLMIASGEREVRMEFFPGDAAVLSFAKTLRNPRGRLLSGVLGSAHQINREPDRVTWLRQHWGTSCEDFESAHIAGCAALFAKPITGLRVIAISEADFEPAAMLAAQLALALVEGRK